VNRIDFRRFLGYPEQIHDAITVWLLRERLAETGRDKEAWAKLQRQLDAKGLRVRKGVAQDASFIEADPGPSGKPRGNEAATRRSRDGDWAVREKGSMFGFKLHVKTDLDLGLVRAVEATSASVHDSRVDLSELGEVVIRDKGYFGVESRGWDATMRRRGSAGRQWSRLSGKALRPWISRLGIKVLRGPLQALQREGCREDRRRMDQHSRRHREAPPRLSSLNGTFPCFKADPPA
jgi:IS5 family transposase